MWNLGPTQSELLRHLHSPTAIDFEIVNTGSLREMQYMNKLGIDGNQIMQLPLLCDTAIQVQKHRVEEGQACYFALFLPSTISWKCSQQHACLPKLVQSAGCGWLWLALFSLSLTACSQYWVIHLQENSLRHKHPEFLLISHPSTLVTLPFSVCMPVVLLTSLNRGCPF